MKKSLVALPAIIGVLFLLVTYISGCCDQKTIVLCPTCPDTTCVGPGCHQQGSGSGGQ